MHTVKVPEHLCFVECPPKSDFLKIYSANGSVKVIIDVIGYDRSIALNTFGEFDGSRLIRSKCMFLVYAKSVINVLFIRFGRPSLMTLTKRTHNHIIQVHSSDRQ